jgi:hypothetical protein
MTRAIDIAHPLRLGLALWLAGHGRATFFVSLPEGEPSDDVSSGTEAPSAAPVCNLSAGTWSNSKTKDIGHIEFDQ